MVKARLQGERKARAPLFFTRILSAAALLLPLLPAAGAGAGTVEYDLVLSRAAVNYTGKDVRAMVINGTVPGPTLRFTEGDHAVIRVRNEMDEETSVHWHGIILPNIMDGVPYVTTPPIRPGGLFTYEFDVVQSGTYWYHSHTNLQEQLGVYGSIVIEPRDVTAHRVRDLVLVLSDWTDEDPGEVLRTLKRGSEWYSVRKGTAQSWDRVIAREAVGARLRQSWGRMPPMDVSDVAYDAFLVNGSREISLDDAAPGETIRLRIINAAASTYFHLRYAGGPMTVVAADGPEVRPTPVESLVIAIAETYDVLVTVPPGGAWELRATAQDASGHASLFLGGGERREAPGMTPPDPFMMHNMAGMRDMESMAEMERMGETTAGEMPPGGGMAMPAGHGEAGPPSPQGEMDMPRDRPVTKMPRGGHHTVRTTPAPKAAAALDYSMLRSTRSTRLPDANPVREVRLELTGSMERYVWAFDGRTLSEADTILIRRGENVRFVLVNTTMMHHPMHLHGHFFRVVAGQGDFAPLKHTVDVPPMGTVVMEFEADAEKDWFFHCHILYHMMSGMARVVRYEDSTVDPILEEARKDRREMADDDWFAWGEAAVMSHMHAGEVELSNTRNRLRASWDANWEGEYEIDADYERPLSPFLGIYAGGTFTGEDERGVAGIRYTLPLLIESDLRVDTAGDLRLELGGDLLLLPRLEALWSVDTDGQWEVGARYSLTKGLALAASWHSEYDAGAGLLLRF